MEESCWSCCLNNCLYLQSMIKLSLHAVKSVSCPCCLPPTTGCGSDLRHHKGMLGPRPWGPTYRPLCCRTHLWAGRRDGQAIQPQLLIREDPWGAQGPNRGGDPREGSENHRDTRHHNYGPLCQWREVRGGTTPSQKFFNKATYSTLMGILKNDVHERSSCRIEGRMGWVTAL